MFGLAVGGIGAGHDDQEVGCVGGVVCVDGDSYCGDCALVGCLFEGVVFGYPCFCVVDLGVVVAYAYLPCDHVCDVGYVEFYCEGCAYWVAG